MAIKNNKDNSLLELKKSIETFKQKSEATSDIVSDNINYIKSRFNYINYNIKRVKSTMNELSNTISEIKKVK